MAEKDMILTYDIGTTGNKCSLFSIGGRLIHSVTVSYDTIYPKAGWAEQKPEDFWTSVVASTKKMIKEHGISASRISVVGLSGHMNGCIPVDKNGGVLYNDIIHSDSRSIEECREIESIIGCPEYYRITGNRLDPHNTIGKILWLKKNYPQIYDNSAFFLASKDYINYKLTGKLGVTDYSDASMYGMLDINNKKWAEEMIGSIGLDAGKLPLIKKSYDIAGYITDEASSILGLKAGTPVVVGGGDGACATKGAGVIEKLQAYNYIGSSSWISILNDKPVLDRDARIFNFIDLDGENCNVCGTVQCASSSYDWVLNTIGKHELKQCKKNGVNVFDYIDRIAESVPIGSNGVFFLPYLMGERSPLWDENTKGGFIGMTLATRRDDLFRATYEGVAFALKSIIDVYEENGIFTDSLTLIGGGAMSLLWNEIMCSVYGKRVMIRKYPREATSFGAVMAAGVGVGVYKDFKSAVDLIEYDRIYDPEKEKVERYMRYYGIYKMMYPSLKNIFSEISRL